MDNQFGAFFTKDVEVLGRQERERERERERFCSVFEHRSAERER